MYNDGRFDLTRFSVNPETSRVETTATFLAELAADVGAAVPVESTAFMSEVFIRGQIAGTIAMPGAFASDAAMRVKVRGLANIVDAPLFGATVYGSGYGSKDMGTAQLIADDVEAHTWVGKTMPVSVPLFDAGAAYLVQGSKNLPGGQLTTALYLTAVTAAEKEQRETVTMLVSIPAGGELRIDSDTFRAILDGQNVLHAQSGDWITLTRGTRYVDIEAATGGPIEGDLIYQERYL